jgi:hypothetical protein
MKYYEYCPSCKHIETKEDKLLPKAIRFGTDGFGQPVRFADCECGKEKGFLDLSWYEYQGEVIDDKLLAYLRGRIEFYTKKDN